MSGSGTILGLIIAAGCLSFATIYAGFQFAGWLIGAL